MMRQSKLESAVESILNVGSGFVIGALMWNFAIAPLWGYEITPLDSLAIPALFTGISILRSYVWRRFFERRIRRRLFRHVSEDTRVRHWG